MIERRGADSHQHLPFRRLGLGNVSNRELVDTGQLNAAHDGVRSRNGRGNDQGRVTRINKAAVAMEHADFRFTTFGFKREGTTPGTAGVPPADHLEATAKSVLPGRQVLFSANVCAALTASGSPVSISPIP